MNANDNMMFFFSLCQALTKYILDGLFPVWFSLDKRIHENKLKT